MNAYWLNFLTDFADQAVILPLLLTVAAVLGVQRRWRAGFAWLLAIPGVLGAILVLKILCYGCGWLLPMLGPDRLALMSPSGHVGSAAVVYGGMAVLAVRGTRMPNLFAFAVALAIAVAIGITRVMLGAHSLSETVVACVVGVVGAVVFALLAGPAALRERSGRPVLLCSLLALLLFHGRHLPAESIIQSAAVETLRNWVVACQPG